MRCRLRCFLISSVFAHSLPEAIDDLLSALLAFFPRLPVGGVVDADEQAVVQILDFHVFQAIGRGERRPVLFVGPAADGDADF